MPLLDWLISLGFALAAVRIGGAGSENLSTFRSVIMGFALGIFAFGVAGAGVSGAASLTAIWPWLVALLAIFGALRWVAGSVVMAWVACLGITALLGDRSVDWGESEARSWEAIMVSGQRLAEGLLAGMGGVAAFAAAGIGNRSPRNWRWDPYLPWMTVGLCLVLGFAFWRISQGLSVLPDEYDRGVLRRLPWWLEDLEPNVRLPALSLFVAGQGMAAGVLWWGTRAASRSSTNDLVGPVWWWQLTVALGAASLVFWCSPWLL